MWDMIVSVPDHCLSFYFALKAPILILDSCRFGHFDRPKSYQIFQQMAPFDLMYMPIIQITQRVSFNVCILIKYIYKKKK